MSRKTLFVMLSLLVLLIGSLFVFFRFSRVSRVTSGTAVIDTPSATHKGELFSRGARTQLHPLASKEKLAVAKRQPVETWDEWVDATAEILLAEAILYGKVKTSHFTMYWQENNSEEVARQRTHLREMLTRYRERLEWWLKPPPEYPGGFQNIFDLGEYEGPYPQTSESLLAEFDAVLTDKYPGAAYLDEHYPKEAWLQTLLEKGAHFKNYNDYRFYLGLRKSLLQKKNNPEEWISGEHGIPITTNFEEYIDGFIDRKVWEYSIVQKVRLENPETSSSVYFDVNDPDKYFPVVGRMTYVNIGKNRERMSTSGTLLTDQQHYNLLNKGIEPKDIEIVYLDDDNNVISKPPPLVDERQRDLENVVSFDGTKVTPENYERLLGQSAPNKWFGFYETEQNRETQDITQDPDAKHRTGTVREAAQAEYEKFENRLRQLESFATMSDAEIEKQLERQFRKQFLPEHPIEQLEQITPERLERALGTLFQHGFEDGMRHIRKDNAALADTLERHFGKRAKPPAQKLKPPQRPAPPKPPSEPPAASTETQ